MIRFLVQSFVTCAVIGAFSGAPASAQHLRAHDPVAIKIKQEIRALVEDQAAKLNSKSAESGQSLHYPSYRLSGGVMQVTDHFDPREVQKSIAYLESTGWDKTVYDSLKFIHITPTKVHLDIGFKRYRKDGSFMDAYRSLYIYTKEGGKWGRKFSSTWADLANSEKVGVGSAAAAKPAN